MEKSEYFRNLLRGAMERRGRFIKTEIKETQSVIFERNPLYTDSRKIAKYSKQLNF